MARDIGRNVWHVFSLKLFWVTFESVVILKSVESIHILSCDNNHILVEWTERNMAWQLLVRDEKHLLLGDHALLVPLP